MFISYSIVKVCPSGVGFIFVYFEGRILKTTHSFGTPPKIKIWVVFGKFESVPAGSDFGRNHISSMTLGT